MIRKNGILLISFVVMAAAIIMLSGCSVLSEIDFPTPPVFPTETSPFETADPTPTVTASPTPSPTLTPTAMPDVSPTPSSIPDATPSAATAPTPTPVPIVASTASPAPTPSPTPTPASYVGVSTAATVSNPAPTPARTTAPIIYASPTLTIENQTLPSDMTQYSVFSLYGIVRTDCGSISSVTGTLYRSSGEAAQQSSYYPYASYFTLAGTIDNDLHFATLTPDTYIYQLAARAENGTAATETVLINRSFTVTARVSASSGGSQGNYTAKKTADSDNAALIWNFFIDEFNNPYAAAAILGNIYTESNCDPKRVEGDLSGSFSSSYTAQVDSGAISKDSFVNYAPGDSYGNCYGLCQWSSTRKANLYDLAVSRGASVGDLTTQCEFIMQELESEYSTLLEYLRTADDAEAAAFEFCQVYEKAAVHGGRTTYAADYLVKYAS